MNSSEPSPKVVAAAGGGGLGIAIAVIIVWILDSNGIEVPPAPASAIGSVISAVLAAAGGWLKRDPLRDIGSDAIDDGDVISSDVA